MTHVKFNRKPFANNFVDEIFNELPLFFKNDFNKSGSNGGAPVNVKESEKSFELELVAPGFEKTDFKIDLDKDLLTISVEKNNEVKEETSKMIRHEYSYHSFKRSFTIDDKIDATDIDASYINGVLRLNLPKKEEVKASAKAITIK